MTREQRIFHDKVQKLISGEEILCRCETCGEEFIFGDEVFKVGNSYYCEDCINDELDDEDPEDYRHTLDDDDIEEPDWDSMRDCYR